MKIRTPKTYDDLLIKKKYNVLEVGGGNHPDRRANVVVDKYVDDNTHRSGNLVVLKNQKFLQADGEHLPFKDHEFDYVICRHVLEHVEDPIQFVKEQARVAKMGYLETPSLLGEYIAPKESHRWVIQDIDGKLVLYDKEYLNFKPWDESLCDKMLVKRSYRREIGATISAMFDIMRTVTKSKVLRTQS